MPWNAAVEDEAGRRLADLLLHHHDYVLPEGQTVSMETCVAWCRKCNRFTVAEDIKTPDAMEKQFEQVSGRYRELREQPMQPVGAISAEQQQQVVEKVLELARQRYDLLKRIFKQRKSAARCLECGGRDFVRVERDIVDWVPDPRGGDGKIRVRITEAAQSTQPPGRYNIEGKRITREK